MNSLEDLIKLVPPLVSAMIGGAVVAFANHWLSNRRDRKKWQLDFIDKQLRLLYSPLFALRKEIRILSENRQKIVGVWDEVSKEPYRDHATNKDQALRMVDYNNKQLKDTLMPQYRKMVSTLKENLWLAEPETVDAMGGLINFVDLWDRYFDKSIDGDVANRVGANEESIKPFYAHIEAVHKRLSVMVKNGVVS